MRRRPIVTISTTTFAAVGLAVSVTFASPATTQAGGGCHVDQGAGYTEGTATVVRMDVCSFEPTVVRVPVGTNMRFINTAQNDHAVSGRLNTWGSPDILAPGAEFSHRFSTAGIYPFTCPLHPGMVGTVIVGGAASAAAAVSDAGAATVSAPAATVTDVQTGWSGVVPAAIGGTGAGAVIGLLIGFLVARRRPAATPADAIRTSAALDG